MFNQIGVDTVQLIANYTTVIKMVERMGLSVTVPSKNSPVSRTITDIENIKDHHQRYKHDEFKAVTEVVKLTKGKSVSNYIIITKNIPLLFDHATHHKKAKDSFCLLTFTGLHQPNSKNNSDAMKIVSKFFKRKTFKRVSIDIAIDTQEDKEPIAYKRKEPFRANLMPYSKHGVIIPPNGATSLYINRVEGLKPISKVLYYDKYLKEKNYLKREVNHELKNWKRLEVTLTFDATDRNNKGFTQYMESMDFMDDVASIDEVARLAKVKTYDTDYLIYQINSLLDNRFMNNRESKEQFNSVESLTRFKVSDFRRFILVI
ncbi:MAG: Unknown protein [uncultured Sulfurovum sp.]|uniref:Uncharacterized protein n=1 Tax=uncultured Sulfurovum sp. TaxID=269237 RepID=A0A6S6SKJ3_9BACT|nr:MAG: Unknown protein [uncultured Sulfurovum sp.]